MEERGGSVRQKVEYRDGGVRERGKMVEKRRRGSGNREGGRKQIVQQP